MAGRFAFWDDAEAFETLKKAGGTVRTIAAISNAKKAELCVEIEIGGIEFRAFKTVKTEVAEHLLTDELSERKAS